MASDVTELSATATPGKPHSFAAKDAASPALIDGDASFDLEHQHESIIVQSDGSDWWIL